ECPFWAELTRACAERGLRFDVHEFGTALGSPTALGNKLIRMEVRGPLFETLRRAALGIAVPTHRLLARQIRRNFDLSRVIAELQGGDIFLDGSKDATRLKHFIDAGLWDVRVIYLQRDGRGVSASIAKHLG